MSPMALRVQERLMALGISASEAARRAGLERGFLSELLSGKKKSIKGDKLRRVAEVLQCDPAYLLNADLSSGSLGPNPADGETLRIAGVAEAGTYRRSGYQPESPPIPILRDPLRPLSKQEIYFYQGQGGEKLGFIDGMYLVTAIIHELSELLDQAGKPVIVKHEPMPGLVETTVRIVERIPGQPASIMLAPVAEPPPEPMMIDLTRPLPSDLSIVGPVVKSVRFYTAA